MTEHQTLGNLRAAADLTQEELAAQADLSRITIAKLELGDHQPNLDTLRKLAAVLGNDVYTVRYGWRRKPGGKRGRPTKQELAELKEAE